MQHKTVLHNLGPVRLEPLLSAHVKQAYVDWLNDDAVVGQTEQAGRHHTLDTVRAYVETNIAAPDAMLWRILFNDAHVGNIRLSGISQVHCRATIALIVGNVSLHSRGIGSQAIALLAEHALSRLGIQKLTAGIYATNPGSRRAFEKAQFHLEAVLRAHRFHCGSFVDVWQMARFAPQRNDCNLRAN